MEEYVQSTSTCTQRFYIKRASRSLLRQFFFELNPNVFDVFPLKTVLSLEFQPLLTLRFAKVTCAKP